jgi:hypothetical protein
MMGKHSGFLVPRPSKCTECKGGTKGMDVCETCKGSGTIFRVNGTVFPDTRDGYEAAERALNHVPSTQDDPYAWLRTAIPMEPMA